MSDLLLPAENMALTVARAQVERGESPTPNVSAVLVMALDRLADEFDPVTRWCFNHQEEVFTDVWTNSMICVRHVSSPCDVAAAAVIRVENAG